MTSERLLDQPVQHHSFGSRPQRLHVNIERLSQRRNFHEQALAFLRLATIRLMLRKLRNPA
jgi:hypothetical protein